MTLRYTSYILFILSIILIISCDEQQQQTSEDTPLTAVSDSISIPILAPKKLHDSILEDLKRWRKFDNFKASIYDIGISDTILRNKNPTQNQSDVSFPNNTFQNLYYQIISLKENIISIDNAIPPGLLNTKAIRSRILLLKTFVLKIEYLIKQPKGDNNNASIVSSITQIFEAYNNLLGEIEREYTRKFDERDVNHLIKNLGQNILDSIPKIQTIN